MARTTIARTTVTATGFNLTDATFTTMATGAGNGIEVPYHAGDLIVLRNDTGGAAVYTIKTAQPASYSGWGLTVTDLTVTVAAGKIWVIEPTAIWKQSDSDLYIDCDVAGKVLVLAVGD